jgi:hypothetical protein
MTDGKFATRADVTGRFEGTIPSNRLAWVDLRIGDVEGELMFQVPSLRKSLDDIAADSVLAGDPDRLKRVTSLVADKVLDLYRNPGGPTTQHSTTTPDVTVSRAWAVDATRGRVQFTAAELDSVRLHTRRQRFGTIQVDPGLVTRDRPWWGYDRSC